ncbi:hypothetical protein IGI04_014868 [Brassica rapa subsp. trilocularis]|uniref:Zinc knuckle CX2CX4HX4C domain-containing protein n=1 Tax=Brassica rapa subsp. trilocularis TaxID=1813537 RepID=A0ABQ7MNE4_BRACM|nr:hypothetical protein IGI04_014868 [Brassica rapa subsp. trilocularis]
MGSSHRLRSSHMADIKVIGLPLHLWTDKNLRNIGARLGHVHVDTLDVAEGRMLVDVDSRRPLKFSRKVESKDGDEVTIEIKYEMLFKHCSMCGMLTHEKDHCPSVSDMRSRLQTHTERPAIFTRMQLPQEQAQRYAFHNERRASDLSRQGSHMEAPTRYLTSSGYGEDDRKKAQRKPYSDEIRSTHADRIVRHHSDRSRSNRYGGSRDSKGPYDRPQRQTWQAKAERTRHPVPSVRSREIVPYEQSSPIRNDGMNGPIEHQGIRSGDGKTAKRLASTIVTPSRSGHDMEENVTKRAKGLTRSLSFTSLSEQEPAATDGDNQIIGALNDMDIEDQQEEEVMECDAPDEDLLGMELKEMEDTAARHDANIKTTCQDDNVNEVNEANALKSSKQGTRANVPLGFQSKKFEVLRRGSPRKSFSSSQGVTNNDTNQVLSLGNICLLDGSWTASDRLSGCGWVWMDSREDIQLMGTRNFTRCESALHSEVEALRWAMENMLQHSPCQSFGTDCKELIAMINEPQEWPRFATELEKIETLQICFPDFKITHVPRVRNQLSDFLAKTARSFRRELLFIGCSIPVWLPRPPQA